MKVQEIRLQNEVDADRRKARNLINEFQSLVRSIRRDYSFRPKLHHAPWFYTANIIERACKEIDGLWELEEHVEKKEPNAEAEQE